MAQVKRIRPKISEVKKQVLALITSASAFVAALVWRDVFRAWLSPLYEGTQGRVGLTIAAIVTSVIVVVITITLARILGEKDKSKR